MRVFWILVFSCWNMGSRYDQPAPNYSVFTSSEAAMRAIPRGSDLAVNCGYELFQASATKILGTK